MSKAEEKPGGERAPNGQNGSYILPKKVGIIFSDVKREYFPTEAQFITEKTALRDATVIAGYINKLNIETILYPGTPEVAEKLRHDKPDMVLNLVGSVRGNEYLASTIPAMLEFLDIPYTGAGILGESLSYNKFLVKKLLQQHGIPLPNYQLFNTPSDPLDPILRFPLISKLNEIHGSVEITRKYAVSENEKDLRSRLKFLMQTYEQPVVVEEFIVGREISAFLLWGVKRKVYMSENIFEKPQGKYVFADFETQWLEKESHITNQKYEDPVLRELVKKAFEVTRMADYGKFDIRIDGAGRYYFIDSNSNPFFGPKEIDCPMASVLEMYGVTFTEILKRLLSNTMRDATRD